VSSLLTVADVAQRIGRSPSRVRTYIRAGRFPHAGRIGRKWVIPVADVDLFLRKGH
jgi:excisionase family DNA binding protein